ncbi:MAG: GNAT family N-acetyltransferase, partial [Candidatus Promineifilaceae bacterium]
TLEDSYRAFRVVEESLADLNRRIGSNGTSSADNPEALARMWEERRSLYQHLATSADSFWLAERENRTIGLSRSIERDGLRILTELFVLPAEQSAGIGKGLLTRAFPNTNGDHRIIISSPDLRAQALYRGAGLIPRFSLHYLWREPEAVAVDTDLVTVPIETSTEHLEILGTLDKALLGHRREADHSWLLTDRQGYIYFRDDQPVGYGYIGQRSGPFALLDSGDYPAVLAQAENSAASRGSQHFGLEVPDINRAALNYLTTRGYKKDELVATLMSNVPVGKFENYLVTSPPFIL